MSGLYLSRVRLAPTATAQILAGVLIPEDDDARTATAHRLLWTLFHDRPDRERDFLWREETGGRLDRLRFLTLSHRPPEPDPKLLAVETKSFAPALSAGQRLAFTLRANPVVTRWNEAKGKPRRDDVVMSVLRPIPTGPERAAARGEAIVQAGRSWLDAQGGRHGFQVEDGLRVDGYLPRLIPRDRGRAAVRFSTLDFEGVLTVTDPDAFLTALALGFGKAKAWGCGLMLIRRAP